MSRSKSFRCLVDKSLLTAMPIKFMKWQQKTAKKSYDEKEKKNFIMVLSKWTYLA